MKYIVKIKFKGGALYYAILMALLIMLICEFFLVNKYLNKKTIDIWEHINITENAAINGIYFTIAFTPDDNEVKIEDELINLGTNLKVIKQNWGIYFLIKSICQHKKTIIRKVALTGMQPENETALYIPDNNIDVSVSSRVSIVGNCYFPSKIIKRAYLTGSYNVKRQPVKGEIIASKGTLPKLNKKTIDWIKKYYNSSISTDDSLINFNDLSTRNINHSFEKKTLVLYSDDNLYLDNAKFKGNIIVISKSDISISSSASLSDIIILGKKIFIQNNFKGNLQVFAEDSMIIKQNCTLEYPSAAGIINFSGNTSSLQIGNKSKVFGMVIHYDEKTPKITSRSVIAPSVVIIGQLYSTASVMLPENIIGAVYCNKIIFKSVAAEYVNLLKNININVKQRSGYYADPCSLSENADLKTIKWLY